MLVVQVQGTPGIVHRAMLASLNAEAQLCLCQVAQGSGLGFLTLADGHHQRSICGRVTSHLAWMAQ